MKLALAGLAVLAAGTARADVEVQSVGSHLRVNATAAPLSRVLQGIALETGAKVVYEGPQPRALVSVKLQDRSPVDTVVGLLEGLGVNYVLQADHTGTKVRTLLVVSRSAGGSVGGSAHSGAEVASAELPATPAGFLPPAVTRAGPPPPDEGDDEDEEDEEEEEDDMDDDEDVEDAQGAPAGTPSGAPSSPPASSGWPTPLLPDNGRPRLIAPPGAGVAPAPRPSPAPGSQPER